MLLSFLSGVSFIKKQILPLPSTTYLLIIVIFLFSFLNVRALTVKAYLQSQSKRFQS